MVAPAITIENHRKTEFPSSPRNGSFQEGDPCVFAPFHISFSVCALPPPSGASGRLPSMNWELAFKAMAVRNRPDFRIPQRILSQIHVFAVEIDVKSADVVTALKSWRLLCHWTEKRFQNTPYDFIFRMLVWLNENVSVKSIWRSLTSKATSLNST